MPPLLLTLTSYTLMPLAIDPITLTGWLTALTITNLILMTFFYLIKNVEIVASWWHRFRTWLRQRRERRQA